MHSTQDSKFRLAPPRRPALLSNLLQLVEFSRAGSRTSAVLVQDRDTHSVHGLYGFNTAQLIPPDQAQRDAGKANGAGELYLVIELVRPDTKHLQYAIPLFLLMLTAQEGRLQTDTDASLNTGWASCATAAASYWCAPEADF